MPVKKPIAPLPPQICSDVPGTWAHDTMSRRVREEILRRVFRENDFHPSIVSRLERLDRELVNAGTTPLSPIEEDGGPDVHTWNREILPASLRLKQTWLSAPWAVAEFYLYRRLMTAIEYFSSPVDPFVLQKELGLSSAIHSISTLCNHMNKVVCAESQCAQEVVQELQRVILTSLWGNRMDLSLWPVGETASEIQLETSQKMILSNHLAQLCDYIVRLDSAVRMDIIVDNAGFELFCDLCLADFLISSSICSEVHLQLKAHPTFVSDAMGKDVMHTIHFLKQGPNITTGKRWEQYVTNGKWKLNQDFFWVQPQAMWEMPEPLSNNLSASALVFVKGDANYRRLLGDREWNFQTPFAHILCYFPAPICALRTLKAQVGCGMPKSETQRAQTEDANWLVAGKYGVIQFCDTTTFS